jgi:ABC-type lipoprotein export system ATPase subunit
MQLRLQHLIPIPLGEKIRSGTSDIWNRQLQLDTRDIVFVQAASGKGKTTLLHILYGLRTDFSGNASWDGNEIPTISKADWASLRASKIAVVFQDLRLFPNLTCLENIEIKRQLTNAVAPETVQIWLSDLGIADKANAPAYTLSFGEKQRTAIIRALAQPFSWLLMDEPFSHLDNNNIKKAAALIQSVVAANKAAMLVADLDDNSYFDYNKKLRL